MGTHAEHGVLGLGAVLPKQHPDVRERGRVVRGLPGAWSVWAGAGPGARPTVPCDTGAWTARPRVRRLWRRPHAGTGGRRYKHLLLNYAAPPLTTLIRAFHNWTTAVGASTGSRKGCSAPPAVGLPPRSLGNRRWGQESRAWGCWVPRPPELLAAGGAASLPSRDLITGSSCLQTFPEDSARCQRERPLLLPCFARTFPGLRVSETAT